MSALARTTQLPALKRSVRPYAHRSIAFYERGTGRLVLEATGQALTLSDTRASALLAACAALPNTERPRVVLLCGGDAAESTPSVAWFREPVAHGWALDRWYNAADHRTGVYSRDGVTMDLRMAAPWFSGIDAAQDAGLCLEAWSKLRRALRFGFGEQIELLTTPGMTGSELLEASLAYGAVYPTLPAALRSEIRAFSTQGRRQAPDQFPHAPTETLAEAWLADSVWQYAACLHGLPTGRVVRDHEQEFAGYTPGFYRVWASVPRDWRHIGLLPYRESDGATTYPNQPGQRFQCWVTGAELQLANREGWRITILERILWPDTGRMTDPAKLWIGKLRDLRSVLLTQDTPVAHLAAGAVRHLVIDTIGRWHAADREEHGILPLARIDELPDGAIPHIEHGEVLWMRPAPLDPRQLKHSHPEWSATVWGRSRARTATFALTLPYDSLMRIHTDGVWTTANLYTLAERGVMARPGQLPPGSWRIKAHLPGPAIWPRDEAAFLALLATVTDDEGEG